MIGYITLGTADVPRATGFFDKVLGELGWVRAVTSPGFVGWHTGVGSVILAVTHPFDQQAPTAGNGTMVALKARHREAVDTIHALALELGASDEGAPGPRGHSGFYAGYFRDLDGNKFNVYVDGQ